MTSMLHPLVLHYDRPATRWVEALPIGNGRIGAMVFGGVAHERLQLNEDTLWSGFPRAWDQPDALKALPEVRRLVAEGRYADADQVAKRMQGPFTQSYLPMGDLHLECARVNTVDSYLRLLDLDKAIATTEFSSNGVRYTRESFVSTPHQVLVVHMACSKPGGLTMRATLTSPLRAGAGSEGIHLMLNGQAPRHVDPNYYPAAEPVVYDQEEPGDGMRFSMRLAAELHGGSMRVVDEHLVIIDADAVTFYLSAATSFAGFQYSPGRSMIDPSEQAYTILNAALRVGYDRLRAAHLSDHRALFRRVELDLGGDPALATLPTNERIRRFAAQPDPGLATLLFQYGRYLLITSSRPGTQPANLQGIWNDQLRPPWSSNWTVNINTQMNYWPAEPTNLAECHTPLFDMISELAINGRDTAQTNYGCRGWVAHHNADLWRQSGAVGDWGKGDPVWALWPMAAPWLCQHLWEHYAFGGDLEFLRERAYPLMRAAAEFCLDWLFDDGNGHLITCPSTSPENKFTTPDGQTAAVSAASTHDMQLIWDLFSNCIAAADVLAVDDAFRAELLEARADLFPLQIGQHGQLQEWASDWDSPDDHHRHVSHLFGLHPGHQITRRGTPELWNAARRSLEMRGDEGTGWSIAWKICFWARFEDGNHAHQMLRTMLRLTEIGEVSVQGGGVYPNLFDAHPPFQIDGNFGATAGIVEMLLQSQNGELHLLPALPDAWPHGSVRGLRARGGYTIAIAWESGKLTKADIHATRTGVCRVRSVAPISVFHNGEVVACTRPEADLISFPVEQGAEYVLRI